jgi:cupin fold WbuC family metalloprotein
MTSIEDLKGLTNSESYLDTKSINSTVIQANYGLDRLLKVDRKIINSLKLAAASNVMKRARLCAHQNTTDKVHEMLIGFYRDSYVRPHRHTSKIESFHVIQGKIEIVFFNEIGDIKQRILLGTLSSNLPFYFRSAALDWHTVLIHSNFAIIHEITNGPFVSDDNEFAPWSPEITNIDAVQSFMKRIKISQK